METEFTVVYDAEPEKSAWGLIGNNLDAYNKEQAGDYHSQRICFVVQAPDGTVVGGVLGMTYWDWLYVDLMWLREDLRGCGYGHQLLTSLEEEAKKCGAKHAHLDTFSFQAPEFYEKHGYRVYGELKDFPAGHTRYYMTKDL